MRKRLTIILSFLILLLIIPGIMLFTELRLPKIYGESYYAELPALYDNLTADSDSNKIVLIGGSNIAFGINSEKLEEYLSSKGFNYRVCPFGLYAAVGTSAMLDLSFDTLKEGDIVVLSFEPVSEAMSTYFGATAFLKCAESDSSIITKLSTKRFGAAVGNYPAYLQERYAIVQSGNYPKAEGAYSKAAFDEAGNMTFIREGNNMTLGYDLSSPINLSELVISEDFLTQVTEYCSKAANKGVSVYYSFCPMNRSALTETSEAVIQDFYRLIYNSFPCRVISNPNNYLLDSGWFYDSNFHLNTAGAELRTSLLANDLLAELGCYATLDVTLPSKPASKVKAVESNADASFFTFEQADNGSGYLITGLTKEGLSQSQLTLPSSYMDLPVAGFVSGCFDKSTALEEIRIPATIGQLPEYAFAGCVSLSRLILEHTDSPCKITEHSLSDIGDVRIYVPAQAYTYYRDGYGCERNLWFSYLSDIYTY